MADQPVRKGAPRGGAKASPTRDFIAENLRALFREADSEPLPEALQALLDRLAREEKP